MVTYENGPNAPVTHTWAQSHILNLISSHHVDWIFTSHWLKKNNENGAPCSFPNDKTTGFKIKLYAHLLLSADIQQRNYPDLYPRRPLLCTECHSDIYNNSHIGFCPAHLTSLNHDLNIAATYLCSLILSSPSAPPGTTDILPLIRRSSLFSPVFNINHPIYLLLHQLVPEELISVISLHIRSRKNGMVIMETFIQYFYSQITQKYWRIHSSSFHSWELSCRITKRKKK
ncbi:hypothetical protein RclHR1_05230002 [Rhizophagus clarus]|uniref:Reverse transcriptase zinc-binding domain-containing protein n=1 Tax=Rhizophagus clarus TaxID=94130 RepID=A0A2Z6S3H5_9GLOM|nr:hypothetical protein RclHR1_05230002 [Rhizophagus clarus]GES88111.1 hypothetical protein GLOIN_2v1763333 [Rhizophagus clarus]